MKNISLILVCLLFLISFFQAFAKDDALPKVVEKIPQINQTEKEECKTKEPVLPSGKGHFATNADRCQTRLCSAVQEALSDDGIDPRSSAFGFPSGVRRNP